MVYYDVRPLGDLIREFIELHKGSGYFDEQRAIQCWSQVVGPFIASHTIDLSIKNQVLFVRVDSDALRSELGYSKSLLLSNLNDAIGKTLLTDIVLC